MYSVIFLDRPDDFASILRTQLEHTALPLSLYWRPLQIRPRIGVNATTLPRIENNSNVNWYPILSQRSTA